MRTANGLFVLLAAAVLCGMVQISAGQSSAKDEVLAALAEQDRAFLAGDETKVGQIKSEDYLQTDVEGNVLDKRIWFKEYFAPLAPRLRSGETRLTRFDRSDIVVRDFGDTLVVVGKLSFKFAGVNPWDPKVTFQPGPPRVLRFTAVWIKRGGAWKEAVLHNATPQEPRNPAPKDPK